MDDKPPQRICSKCFTKIQLIHEFRSRCLEAEEIIEKFHLHIEIEQFKYASSNGRTNTFPPTTEQPNFNFDESNSPFHDTSETHVDYDSGNDDKELVEHIKKPEIPKQVTPSTSTNIEKTIKNVTELCDLCGLSFDNKYDFQRHARTHLKKGSTHKIRY